MGLREARAARAHLMKRARGREVLEMTPNVRRDLLLGFPLFRGRCLRLWKIALGLVAMRVGTFMTLLDKAHGAYAPPLSRFNEVLSTTSRLYLGGDEESFLAEVEWQHDRLKRAEQVVPAEFEPGSLFESSHRSANHGITSAASVGGLAEDRDDRIGTRGTFVAFSGYDNASKARDLLAEAFSPQSVAVLAHSRRYGTGFLVHASPVGVDALLESYAERAEVLESLFAMPPSLKIAPSLLNHVGEASAAAGTVGRALRPGEADTSTHPSETYLSGDKRGLPPEMHPGGHGEAQKLTTLPGKVFHKDGLALYLSPGAVPAGAEKEVVERWRREWQSKNLNLRDIFFWSDRERREQAAVTAGAQLRSEQGGKSLTKEGRRGAGAEDLSGSSVGAETDAGGASLLAREWGGAVRIVHAMAERYGGSPAEACGWDRVRVARESPGLITVRGLGHLVGSSQEADEDVTGKLFPGSRVLGPEELERGRISCVMGLLSFLASRPEVARVSSLPRAELFNAVASRVVQGGAEDSSPLWDGGIDGTGQVIQIVDSGIAEGSCFFRDGEDHDPLEHGYLFDADGDLEGYLAYDLSKRKVVQYIEGKEGAEGFYDDDAYGHGSHVAGSAAGSVYDDWDGTPDCPDGVEGASSDETAVSCVGTCLDPDVLDNMPGDNSFDLDAFCPEYDCDGFQLEYCLGDDRSETLTEAGGVARGAKIAVLDLGGSDGLQPITGGYMWEASSPTEARLHSASWGFPDEPCEVDEASISFDLWAYENREHLLVFAAGNLGTEVSGCSIVSPAVSKNGLAVGSCLSGFSRLATGDIDEVADFSGRGPTQDGRFKPDVLTPGHFVYTPGNSGDGSCELDFTSGTSISCPIAAGAAALVRQFFADGFHAADAEARGMCSSDADDDDVEFACEAFDPTGALVKAILIHGANDMGHGPDPDGERGFGRIQLDSAMPLDGDDLMGLYVEDSLSSSTGDDGQGRVEEDSVEERAFVVSEEDVEAMREHGDVDFRATLVWMDPPATAYATTQLVHDLDLFVRDPEGTWRTMLGVCPDKDSCSLDSANNVERIVVEADDVVAGTWTVQVSAANGLVEKSSQEFALVVSFPLTSGSVRSDDDTDGGGDDDGGGDTGTESSSSVLTSGGSTSSVLTSGGSSSTVSTGAGSSSTSTGAGSSSSSTLTGAGSSSSASSSAGSSSSASSSAGSSSSVSTSAGSSSSISTGRGSSSASTSAGSSSSVSTSAGSSSSVSTGAGSSSSASTSAGSSSVSTSAGSSSSVSTGGASSSLSSGSATTSSLSTDKDETAAPTPSPTLREIVTLSPEYADDDGVSVVVSPIASSAPTFGPTSAPSLAPTPSPSGVLTPAPYAFSLLTIAPSPVPMTVPSLWPSSLQKTAAPSPVDATLEPLGMDEGTYAPTATPSAAPSVHEHEPTDSPVAASGSASPWSWRSRQGLPSLVGVVASMSPAFMLGYSFLFILG